MYGATLRTAVEPAAEATAKVSANAANDNEARTQLSKAATPVYVFNFVLFPLEVTDRATKRDTEECHLAPTQRECARGGNFSKFESKPYGPRQIVALRAWFIPSYALWVVPHSDGAPR